MALDEFVVVGLLTGQGEGNESGFAGVAAREFEGEQETVDVALGKASGSGAHVAVVIAGGTFGEIELGAGTEAIGGFAKVGEILENDDAVGPETGVLVYAVHWCSTFLAMIWMKRVVFIGLEADYSEEWIRAESAYR